MFSRRLHHFVAAVFLMLSLPNHPLLVSGQSITLKAAAPTTSIADCTCQCKGLSFVNAYGQYEGNCRSNYNGQLWCYVHQGRYSTCYDKVASRRFTNEYYSSRACYTPSPYSHECRGGSFQSLGGNSDYYGLDNEIYDEPYRYRGRYGFRRRYGRR